MSEALVKALSESRVVQSRFSPRPSFVQPSLDESERIAAAVVEFLTSDEAVGRTAKIIAGFASNEGPRDAFFTARVALLAAVGGSDVE